MNLESNARRIVPHEIAQQYRKKSFQQVSPLGDNVKKGISLINTQQFSHNPKINAGFTYLGQLIAHDLSYNLINGIGYSTALNLQTLYGNGCYDALLPLLRHCQCINQQHEPEFNHEMAIVEGASFRYRIRSVDYKDNNPFSLEHIDFIRNAQNSAALLKDARNDNNFIIGQLLLLWMRFHNQVCAYLYQSGNALYVSSEELFYDARSIVTSCYRDVVINQYLRVIAAPELVNDLLQSDAHFKIFDYQKKPILMPEFSESAFRMGHSQVRKSYRLHQMFEEFPIFSETEEDLRGKIDRILVPVALDWAFLFHFPGLPDLPLNSSSIDHIMIPAFFGLPDNVDLIQLDIDKNAMSGSGFVKGLNLGAYDYLTQTDLDAITFDEAIIAGPDKASCFGKIRDLPLGLYVLLESEILEKGEKLGPVGSQIIVEQLIWAAKNIPAMPYDFVRQLTVWRDNLHPRHLTIQDIIHAVEHAIE